MSTFATLAPENGSFVEVENPHHLDAEAEALRKKSRSLLDTALPQDRAELTRSTRLQALKELDPEPLRRLGNSLPMDQVQCMREQIKNLPAEQG